MIHLSPPPMPLSGTIRLPYSKSMLNRQLLLSHLAGETVELDKTDERFARDSQILSEALQQLKKGARDIYVRDAGTAMRFMTAVCAITPGEWTLSGTDRMHRRPIADLVKALRNVGADIEYDGEEERPPLKILGRPLNGGATVIRGDVSSQFISALLMIGGHLNDGLDLLIDGTPLSRPYIEMTMEVMRQYDIRCEWQGERIRVEPSNVVADSLRPEADWSAAAFWYAILAVSGQGELTLPDLHLDSPQGDKACIDLFDRLGVSTSSVSEGISIRATASTVDRFEADCRDFPDVAQALAFCCAAKGISCHLTGLETLPGKETDRIAAIRTELSKIGVDCRTDERSLTFEAAEILPTEELLLSTYDDHRMAMAMSCLAVKGAIRMDDGEVVAKSYPGFFKEMEGMGFEVERM